MCAQGCRQIRPLVVIEIRLGNLGVGQLVGEPPMHPVQRLGHTLPGQRADIIGLCLFQEFGHVGGRDGIAVETRFEPVETEGGQHQQPRDEHDEQPRHKQVVNTAKVSVGSRIVTGPHYPMSGVSVRLQP